MAVRRGITVSFKNIKKDLALYEILDSMEDRSTEIKSVLYEYYILGHRFASNEVQKIQSPAVVNLPVNVVDDDIDVTNF